MQKNPSNWHNAENFEFCTKLLCQQQECSNLFFKMNLHDPWRRRWKFGSAQMTNKFGFCPSITVFIVLTFHKHTTAYQLGRYEPSSPPTKELHAWSVKHGLLLLCRITTPSIDSGNPSECSPLRTDGDEHDSLGPLGSNSNFEHDLKQITQKIYSLGESHPFLHYLF